MCPGLVKAKQLIGETKQMLLSRNAASIQPYNPSDNLQSLPCSAHQLELCVEAAIAPQWTGPYQVAEWIEKDICRAQFLHPIEQAVHCGNMITLAVPYVGQPKVTVLTAVINNSKLKVYGCLWLILDTMILIRLLKCCYKSLQMTKISEKNSPLEHCIFLPQVGSVMDWAVEVEAIRAAFDIHLSPWQNAQRSKCSKGERKWPTNKIWTSQMQSIQ